MDSYEQARNVFNEVELVADKDRNNRLDALTMLVIVTWAVLIIPVAIFVWGRAL